MDWTDEQAEALWKVFRAAGIDLDGLVEAVRKICEAMVICYMELEKERGR